MRYWILPLALAMTYAGLSEAAIEKRHESTGQYSIEANLIKCEEGWVTLGTTDGRLVELPVTEFSRADQRWIRTRVSGKTGVPSRPRPAGGRPMTDTDWLTTAGATWLEV